MSILVALLVAAQAAPSPPPTDVVLLDAFRTSCSRVGNVDEMRADALARGWIAIEEDEDPRLARLLSEGRSALPEGARGAAAAFRAPGTAPGLFLTQTRVESGAGWRNVCRLYQFDARAPVDSNIVEHWMTRAATRVEEAGGFGIRRIWDPGWRDGMTVEVIHIPDSEASRALGFSGNVFVARAVGGPQ